MTATPRALTTARQLCCRSDQPISDGRQRGQAPTTTPRTTSHDSRPAADTARRRLRPMAAVATATYNPQQDPVTDPETGCVIHAQISEKDSDTGHQGRSLFTYLTELITAHARGNPFPALA